MNKLWRIALPSLALALLGACGAPKPGTAAPPTAPPVEPGGLHPETRFRIDFAARAVAPLDAGRLAPQTVYTPSGVGLALAVSDQQSADPPIYNVAVTLTNNTGQALGNEEDDTIVLAFPSFQARDSANNPLPGGGIANATGHLAQSDAPFVVTYGVSAGESRQVTVAMSLPAGATKADISILTRANGEFGNNLPGPGTAWLSAAAGRYGQEGADGGPAHLARFGLLQGVAACNGALYFYDATNADVWQLYGNEVSLFARGDNDPGQSMGRPILPLSGRPLSGEAGTSMDCNQDPEVGGLVMAGSDHNMVFFVNSYGESTVVGMGLPGADDGDDGASTFRVPVDVASLGTSVYVADRYNNAIRKIAKGTYGWYTVSTVLSGLAGNAESVAVDRAGNLYFATNPGGVFRLPVGSASPAQQIYDNPAPDFFRYAKLRWNGAGGLFMSSYTDHRLYTLRPSSSNPNAAWSAAVVAGTGAPGTPGGGGAGANTPVTSPWGLAVDKSGTVWMSSHLGRQLLRVDRLR